jgi:hypothetical protein
MNKFFLLLISTLVLHASTAGSAPLDKSVRVEVTMQKITTLIKAEKYSDSLPYFAELESSGEALPESFHYHYISALDKAGDSDQAHRRAMFYLEQYGRKGRYYKPVVEVVSRLDLKKDGETKKQAEAKAQHDRIFTLANEKYQTDVARYRTEIAQCRSDDAEAKSSAKDDVARLQRDCEWYDKYGCDQARDEAGRKLYKRMLRAMDTVSSWPYDSCSKEHVEPAKPVY